MTIINFAQKSTGGLGQVMVAIERNGSDDYLYFRTIGGSPAVWSSWVKVANNSDVEAVREALDNLDIDTDKTLSISGKPADAKAAGDEINDLKADLSQYSDVISLVKNIAPTVIGGKYSKDVTGVITIDNNDGRGYVRIPVVGGKKYAINTAYSTNFSMWGYSSNGVDYTISKLTAPTDKVVTAPDNATVLYISNSGWSSSTDLVVIQTDKSIIGYNKTDYPYNVVKAASIPTLEELIHINANLNAFGTKTEKISTGIEKYYANVVIQRNLVSEVIGGKYTHSIKNKVVIDTDATRGYVKIPVIGGHTYAVNTSFSQNFSMWAYHVAGESEDTKISQISPVPSDYVITAPSNAEYLYLCNSGWTSSTDLVVIETDTSIAGYSKTDYPYNVVKGVSIPKLITRDTLPEYYYANDYFPGKLQAVQDAMDFANGVCFAFITDCHFPANMERSRTMLKLLLDKTNVPFCLYGGDTPALFGDSATLESACDTLISYMAAVGRENWFSVRGNHDLYCRTDANPSVWTTKNNKEIYNVMARTSERFVTNMLPEHMCYCIDIPAQKCRIVMCNSSDKVTPDGGGHISSEQAAWFADVLSNVTDTHIIVVFHIPSDPTIGSESHITEKFQLLMKALRNKSTSTIDGTEYSFANTTNDLVCCINGHMHDDTYHNDDGVLAIVTTCDAAYSDDGYGMVRNTITEQAFDVFLIDFDNYTIRTIRFGRGNNRAWDYAEGVVLDED